ncbi:MAG: DUF6259 domain-containing protein, partial [Candidatus Marinimicrobia bacterium]|nr:DUF6259 domain-containing protein [Candidatus Neomarinimicrobiota bacterium]
AHWSLDLRPADDSLGLWEAVFPVVSGVRAAGPAGAVDYLTTTGYIGRSPRPVLGGFHEGYGRHSVYRRGQYRAYYQDGAGLYLGAHDPGLAPVGTLVRNSGVADGLEFSYLHPTEYMGQPGAGLSLTGSIVLGTFAGDWFDAAQLYRAWLQHQDWFPADPLHAREDVPEWAKQAVVSLRSSGEGAARLHADLGYPPSVNWYYHAWSARDAERDETHPTAKFQNAPDFPTPPGFERRLEAPRREGIKTGVYTINNWWDYTARSWVEDGAREAVVHMLGYDSPMFHNPRGMGIICQATETWMRKQGEVGAQTAAIGADGTYLDLGGGARMPFLCFARNHGHPPGGGAFMTTSKRAALRQLRESARTVNPEFILITEGSEGYFLTVKDGWINFANSTPVSSALYYDYLRPLGNKRVVTRVGPVTREPAGALTPAKHFAWGSSIGRFGYNNEWDDLRWAGGVAISTTNPQALEYYRNLVWHKYVARPWLNLGRMLRPLELTDVTPAPAPEFFADTFVPAAVWQAPDHSVALVFANGWHSQEIAFGYRFDPAVYGLPADGSLALYRLTPEGQPPDIEPRYERVAVLNGPLDRQERLAPGAVLILVVRPAADPVLPMPALEQRPAPAPKRPARSVAPAPDAPAPAPPVIPAPPPRPDAPLPTVNQIEENQELL